MQSTKSTESGSWEAAFYPRRGDRLLPLHLFLLLLLSVASSGCSLTKGLRDYIAYNDPCNDFVMGWRNEVWSRQAWHNQKPYFVDQGEMRAFGAGFRDGYKDVASGGNGCPPAVPPRKYWTWKYQTAEGQCKVAAWFDGYGYGARAAEEDGAANFQDIQVSYAIEEQYSAAFQAGRYPGYGLGEEPVPGEMREALPEYPLPETSSLDGVQLHRTSAGVAPASWTQSGAFTHLPRPSP